MGGNRSALRKRFFAVSMGVSSKANRSHKPKGKRIRGGDNIEEIALNVGCGPIDGGLIENKIQGA